MVAKCCSFNDDGCYLRPAESISDIIPEQSFKTRTISNMIEKLDFQDVMEYDLPLTPPTSPCNFDIDIDLQDFETSLDEIPLPYKKHDSIVIKDCMWSPEDFSSSKIREHSYTRLYIGEPPSNRTIFETPELSSKFLSSVDPAEVFPNVSCVDDRAHVRDLTSSDSEDESDADVDVVTVEPKKIYDFVPQLPEILSPPKTPESEPTECAKVFIQSSPSEIVTSTKPKSHNASSSNNTSENTVKRNKDGPSFQERFSRASHNVLERKRRNELKGKFYHLRDSIPDLYCNKKVPKVVILKRAISFIDSLREEEESLQSELQRQKEVQQKLRKRLASILRQKSLK